MFPVIILSSSLASTSFFLLEHRSRYAFTTSETLRSILTKKSNVSPQIYPVQSSLADHHKSLSSTTSDICMHFPRSFSSSSSAQWHRKRAVGSLLQARSKGLLPSAWLPPPQLGYQFGGPQKDSYVDRVCSDRWGGQDVELQGSSNENIEHFGINVSTVVQ